MRLDDPEGVRAEYADERRLATRKAAHGLGEGPDAREAAFEAIANAAPERYLEVDCGEDELAERVQAYIREKMPEWKNQYDGVEMLTLAVMGCVVNGPGESKAANIGISLPGTGEAPNCPVFIDGEHAQTLRGTYEELAAAFQALVDDYVVKNYPRKPAVTVNR